LPPFCKTFETAKEISPEYHFKSKNEKRMSLDFTSKAKTKRGCPWISPQRTSSHFLFSDTA